MAQLRQDYSQFVALETEILVISPEDADDVRGFWQQQAMPMPGLADPGHEVAEQYGQEVNLLKLGRMPALVIIDRSGNVRYEHRALHMGDFPENKLLLSLLARLNAEHAAQPDAARAG